jgi:hypothetical protein
MRLLEKVKRAPKEQETSWSGPHHEPLYDFVALSSFREFIEKEMEP